MAAVDTYEQAPPQYIHLAPCWDFKIRNEVPWLRLASFSEPPAPDLARHVVVCPRCDPGIDIPCGSLWPPPAVFLGLDSVLRETHVMLERHKFWRRLDGHRLELFHVWAGQCPDCLTIYWFAGPGTLHELTQ